RQSGAAKAEPARREEEDAALPVGIPSPLGSRSHPGSAGTEATAIAWTVAADERHHDGRGIHLGVGCVAELAPGADIPATVTKNEKEPARRGRAWAHPQPPGRDRAMAGGAVSAADGEGAKAPIRAMPTRARSRAGFRVPLRPAPVPSRRGYWAERDRFPSGSRWRTSPRVPARGVPA